MELTISTNPPTRFEASLVSERGNFIQGTCRLVFEGYLPANIPIKDLQSPPPHPRDENAPMGFALYQVSPPKYCVEVVVGKNFYRGPVESVSGNRFVLSPTSAANGRGLQPIVRDTP